MAIVSVKRWNTLGATVAGAALLTALAMGAAPVRAQDPAQAGAVDVSRWPVSRSPAAMTDARTEAFVTALLSRMTLEEKVGQVIQADIGSITPADLASNVRSGRAMQAALLEAASEPFTAIA